MLRGQNFQQQHNGIDYNDEYYADGTTIDRLGRRMSSSGQSYSYGQQTGYYNSRQQNGYYNSQSQQRCNAQNGYYSGAHADKRFSSNGNTGFENQSNSEHVERIVYKSAVPVGDYYNLDDPKNDIRRFAERSNDET